MKKFMMMFSFVALAGCGNTISGVGADIMSVGKGVTTWQNDIGNKDEVNEQAVTK